MRSRLLDDEVKTVCGAMCVTMRQRRCIYSGDRCGSGTFGLHLVAIDNHQQLLAVVEKEATPIHCIRAGISNQATLNTCYSRSRERAAKCTSALEMTVLFAIYC